MLTQKGINIMKALVEEEMANASAFTGNADETVVDQYLKTLSEIKGELHNMRDYFRLAREIDRIVSI